MIYEETSSSWLLRGEEILLCEKGWIPYGLYLSNRVSWYHGSRNIIWSTCTHSITVQHANSCLHRPLTCRWSEDQWEMLKLPLRLCTANWHARDMEDQRKITHTDESCSMAVHRFRVRLGSNIVHWDVLLEARFDSLNTSARSKHQSQNFWGLSVSISGASLRTWEQSHWSALGCEKAKIKNI